MTMSRLTCFLDRRIVESPATNGGTSELTKGMQVMRKSIIGAVVCIGSVVGGGAGAAFAGEVTGGGPGGVPKVTPIGEVHGPGPEAICAYSGLNDGPGTRTQTPANQGSPGGARVCSYVNSGRKP